MVRWFGIRIIITAQFPFSDIISYFDGFLMKKIFFLTKLNKKKSMDFVFKETGNKKKRDRIYLYMWVFMCMLQEVS